MAASRRDSLRPRAPSFIQVQQAFTAYIRQPHASPPPADVPPRRMAVYRELLYSNVESLLAGNFPVLRAVLGEPRWEALIQDYFSRHRARSPLFPYLPEEFLSYLESERGERPEDPPFLDELAHYEWVETALSIAQDELSWNGIDAGGDLLQGVPVLSSLAWPLAYRFPVHRIGPEFRPQPPDAQPTCLVVYRDRRDEVGFMEVNPVTVRLLALLGEQAGEDGPRSGRQVLAQIAGELQHPQPKVVIEAGLVILEGLRQRDIVLGTALPSRAGHGNAD